MAKLTEIKRKRGQHGNIRHGGYSLLVSGEVPKDRLYVKKYLSSVREGVIRDLGGEEEMTTLQIVMLDRLVTALGVTRLIEEYVREKGVLAAPQGFLNPALSHGYVTYSNQVRLACQALGIEKGRVAGSQAALETYLTSFSRVDEPEKALKFEFGSPIPVEGRERAPDSPGSAPSVPQDAQDGRSAEGQVKPRTGSGTLPGGEFNDKEKE